MRWAICRRRHSRLGVPAAVVAAMAAGGTLLALLTTPSCAKQHHALVVRLDHTGQHHALVARIEHMGLIDCFAPEDVDARGNPLSCETSAVETFGNRLLLASDKPTPDTSPSQIMWLNVRQSWPDIIPSSDVQHENNAILRHARKLEAMTVSAENDFAFATTDFDWPPDPTSAEPDAYNTLIYWPVQDIAKATIAHPTANGGVTSSVSLRSFFARALKSDKYPDGPPYFKIEGLAAIPNRTLLFGVREIGPDYAGLAYVFTVLKTTCAVSPTGEVTLASPFTVLTTVDTLSALPGSKTRPGLSSIERDGDRLWFLTSVEAPGATAEHEAYLWSSVLTNGAISPPSVVSGDDGKPLRLPCKAEGLTAIPGSRLFVVCDEDRSPTAIPRKGGPDMVRRAGQGVFIVLGVRGR
jgi:hypothetical protein